MSHVRIQKLQAADYNLQVKSYKLQFVIYKLQDEIYKLAFYAYFSKMTTLTAKNTDPKNVLVLSLLSDQT